MFKNESQQSFSTGLVEQPCSLQLWTILVSILCSSCDPAEIPFGSIWTDMSDDGPNHLASKIRNWWQAH